MRASTEHRVLGLAEMPPGAGSSMSEDERLKKQKLNYKGYLLRLLYLEQLEAKVLTVLDDQSIKIESKFASIKDRETLMGLLAEANEPLVFCFMDFLFNDEDKAQKYQGERSLSVNISDQLSFLCNQKAESKEFPLAHSFCGTAMGGCLSLPCNSNDNFTEITVGSSENKIYLCADRGVGHYSILPAAARAKGSIADPIPGNGLCLEASFAHILEKPQLGMSAIFKPAVAESSFAKAFLDFSENPAADVSAQIEAGFAAIQERRTKLNDVLSPEAVPVAAEKPLPPQDLDSVAGSEANVSQRSRDLPALRGRLPLPSPPPSESALVSVSGDGVTHHPPGESKGTPSARSRSESLRTSPLPSNDVERARASSVPSQVSSASEGERPQSSRSVTTPVRTRPAIPKFFSPSGALRYGSFFKVRNVRLSDLPDIQPACTA